MTEDIFIIDNFINQKYFSLIKSQIENPNFSWSYKNNITENKNNHKITDYWKNSLYTFGFDHCVIDSEKNPQSHLYFILSGFFSQLLDKTAYEVISRCRVDMTTCCFENFMHLPHCDNYSESHLSTIFYLTNSDGNTVIFNQKIYNFEDYLKTDLLNLTVKKIIKPKENRLLIFDGRYLHTGHSPTKSKNRILINTNLI